MTFMDHSTILSFVLCNDSRRIPLCLMGAMRYIAVMLCLGFFLMVPHVVMADCRDVIELAKVTSQVVQGSSDLESAARAFCNEYASAKSQGKTINAGVSYGILSASLGTSTVSAEQVASKYCESSDYSKARSDSFRQYVESIAPGAFSAYERCLALSGSGIAITVSRANVLPLYFAANVSFQSNDSLVSQVIDFAVSPGVKCKWKNGNPKSSQTKLSANTSDTLQCTRDFDSKKSAVQIFPTSKPSSALDFGWERFENGVPADTIKQLYAVAADAKATLDKESKRMQGSVVAFASASCPDGWEEYQAAYGRFVRGIDKSGSSDPDGVRAPGSLQGDQLQDHRHRVADGKVQSYEFQTAPGGLFCACDC